MDANRVKRNQLLAEKVIKGLQARNSEGYYAETKEEALKLALELIPKGRTKLMAGDVLVVLSNETDVPEVYDYMKKRCEEMRCPCGD